MYYIVSEMRICGYLLENCFYCHYQQIISAAAKKSLILYNIRAPETQIL